MKNSLFYLLLSIIVLGCTSEEYITDEVNVDKEPKSVQARTDYIFGIQGMTSSFYQNKPVISARFYESQSFLLPDIYFAENRYNLEDFKWEYFAHRPDDVVYRSEEWDEYGVWVTEYYDASKLTDGKGYTFKYKDDFQYVKLEDSWPVTFKKMSGDIIETPNGRYGKLEVIVRVGLSGSRGASVYVKAYDDNVSKDICALFGASNSFEQSGNIIYYGENFVARGFIVCNIDNPSGKIEVGGTSDFRTTSQYATFGSDPSSRDVSVLLRFF